MVHCQGVLKALKTSAQSNNSPVIVSVNISHHALEGKAYET